MEDNQYPRQIRFSYGISLARAVTMSLGVILVFTLFILPGVVFPAAGSFTPLLVILTGLFLLANLLGYIELSMSVPHAGGAYQLVESCQEGNWLSFSTGWLLLAAGTAAAGVLAQGFAVLINQLLQLLFEFRLPPLLPAAAVVLIIYVNKITTIRKRRNRFLLMLLLLAGISLSLAAFPQADISQLEINDYQWRTAFHFLLLAFLGVEITAGVQGEITRRTTNAPRALLLVPILAAGISALVSSLIIAVLGSESSGLTSLPLVETAGAAAGRTGQLLMISLGTLAIPIALRRVLRMITRLGYAMAGDGFWPKFLLQTHKQSRTPIILISLLTLLVLISLFIPTAVLAQTGSLLYVLVLLAVNFSLVQREQLASSSFTLPIHPWLPSLAVVIDVLLALTWEEYLLHAAGVLLVGSLIYFLYGRHRSIAAKEGITVFKAPQMEQKEKQSIRVLVPIANPDTAETLLHMAGTLVREQKGKVIALRVITVPHQVSLSEGSRQAESDRVLLDRAIAQATQEDFRVQTMTRVSRSVAEGILDTAREEKVDKIILGWKGETHSFQASLGPVIDPVIRNAPCDVLVMKGDTCAGINSILIPTAGGPNAPIGARVASTLSRAYQARVTGLYVQVGRATPRRMEDNRETIEETFSDLTFGTPPETKVIMADNVLDGINAEAENYDLVIIGASEQGTLDQFTFGSFPQRIAAQAPKMSLIVKGFKGTPEFWLRRFLTTIFNLFPTLTTEEQLEVREELVGDAQPGTNYFVMIILSSIIATLGLLLNSPAVVIGAMLVAPLMSPILAFSMGIVLGEVRLIRSSLESVLKGTIASVVVSLLVGLISPFKEITAEILARTQPTLLDLFIALASGMAGAYALSRKGVSAALPGVAIAAALAPPLSAVGVGVATGNVQVAGGAMLLFVTNIITISLAGVLTFILLGIHPLNVEPETKRRVRRGIIGMTFLVVLITIPLGIIMNGIINQVQDQRTIEQVLTENSQRNEFTVMEIERSETQGLLTITVTIRSTDPVGQNRVDELDQELEKALDRPLILEMIRLPTYRSE